MKTINGRSHLRFLPKCDLAQTHRYQVSSLPDVFANVDIEIKHVDIKEHITDIFKKPLDSELFLYLRWNLNGW